MDVPTMLQIETARAYNGLLRDTCPDCEGNWDPAVQAECPTCRLTLDDLRARLERKVSA